MQLRVRKPSTLAALTGAVVLAVGLTAYGIGNAATPPARVLEPTAPTVPATTRLADVKHVWVINPGEHIIPRQLWQPTEGSVPRSDAGRQGRAAVELLRRRPRQPDQLHRRGERPSAELPDK